MQPVQESGSYPLLHDFVHIVFHSAERLTPNLTCNPPLHPSQNLISIKVKSVHGSQLRFTCVWSRVAPSKKPNKWQERLFVLLRSRRFWSLRSETEGSRQPQIWGPTAGWEAGRWQVGPARDTKHWVTWAWEIMSPVAAFCWTLEVTAVSFRVCEWGAGA